MVCNEAWVTKNGTNLYDGLIRGAHKLYPYANFCDDGIYQKKLRALSIDDGIEFEMRNIGKLTIDSMYNWPYYDMPNVLVIK